MSEPYRKTYRPWEPQRYRQEALPKMAQNIVEMDKLAVESEAQIRKVEHAEKAASDFPIEITN